VQRTPKRVAENPEPFVLLPTCCPQATIQQKKNALTCGKTGQGIVEVAGFEPASSGAAIGLLRAQPTSDCRGWHFCRPAVPPRNQQVCPQ
jgi:hypothetical protein